MMYVIVVVRYNYKNIHYINYCFITLVVAIITTEYDMIIILLFSISFMP